MKELYYINDVNVDEYSWENRFIQYQNKKIKFSCQFNTTYNFPENGKDTRIYIIKDIDE